MNRTLLPGHGLVRRKGSVFHIGTYIGWNLVAHIDPEGFHLDSLEVFAAGQKISITGQAVPIDVLHQRLHEAKRLFKAYDPLFRNCEHLASFLQKGVQESPQMQGAVMGLTVAAGAIAASKMHPVAGLATAVICTWAGVQLMSPTAAQIPASL